jgi:hypothetical protein
MSEASADKFRMLLQKCESHMGRSTYWECFGYVMGVSDTLDALKTSGATPNMRYCQGVDVAATRVVQVAALHMTEHLETLDQPASYLVTFALIEAYPCPAKLREPITKDSMASSQGLLEFAFEA